MASPSSTPVAESGTESKVGHLENDLRNMILGNVTISNGQNNQNGPQIHQQQHFRGRGRGRGAVAGGFFGGRGDGNFQGQAGRGHQAYRNMAAAPASHSAMRGSPRPRFTRATAPSPPADNLHPNQESTNQEGTSRPEPEQRYAYLKNVTSQVEEGTLRAALSRFGDIECLTINRAKECAFVDFKTVKGYQDAVSNSPLTINSIEVKVRHARTQQGRKPHSGPNQQAPSGIRGRVEAPTNQSPTILQRPPRSYTHNSTSLNQQPKNPLSSPATLSQRPPQPHVHPRPQVPYQQIEDPTAQVKYLDLLASEEVPKVEITMPEMEEKETFRNYLEALCQKALAENYSGDIATINLAAFGSLASGFATPGSDMDLAVVPGWKDPFKTHEIGIDKEIPRLLEKVILDAKMGARLLTRTRVPILKVCQKPSNELHHALSEERQKWEALPEEEKYAPSAPPERKPLAPTGVEGSKNEGPVHNFKEFPTLAEVMAGKATKQATGSGKVASPITTKDNGAAASNESENGKPKQQHQRNEKQPWLREKSQGPLDFPKSGVGIQCDINFENPLGIHNTQLLRCYSMCDPRVRPMVLFVKAWAKQRKINSSYSGTLSSYGWVLMVLHYLVNIAQPAVCPNLQMAWRPSVIPIDDQALQKIYQETVVSGYAVRFWRNEEEILHAASSGQLTRNRMTIGELLRGFFQYYSSMPQSYTYGSRAPSFYWTNEVLSLRTPGGLRTKAEKGWTGAKTTISNGKEVRNRYLFSIEDPFEIDHNVARTVTHNGIVAIRDEFRRAWRILRDIGRGQHPEGGIFDAIVDRLPPPTSKEPEAKAGEGVEFLPIRKKPEVGVRDEEERVAIAAKTFTGEGKASTKLDGEGQE